MIVHPMTTQTLSDSPQVLYQKKAEVYSSDLGKEVVLLHQSKGIYFGLKGVGIHLWPLLDQPISVHELLSQLRKVVPDTPPHAEAEIKTFILDLLNADLIDVADASKT